MLTDEVIVTLRGGFRGDLIGPSDTGYDEARKVHNAMINRRPRLIARCRDAADVITALAFGRANGLRIAVRGGGHNAGGLGICDDGLVIDLSPIRNVHVDPKKRTVRAGGGATWGDVNHATHAFGLAVPSGIISTTGVGGLTLGGGLGHLTRPFGLTIDNLLEADVVLADGRFVTANAKENGDLFWALRGGGGNFGIVTSFLFRAHPVHTLHAGPMLYDIADSVEVLNWYSKFITKAPTSMGGFFAFLTVPAGPPFPVELHGKKMCGVIWCYSGPAKQAEKAFKPIRAFKKPVLDFVGPLPHPVLQSMFDPLCVAGNQWYWKADFIKSISDKALALHAEHGLRMPTPLSTMHLYPINGAASRPKPNATAWPHRNETFACVIVGVDPDPANAAAITKWSRDYWEALHPHSSGSAYVNFMMDEGDDRVRATYGKNYARLAKIKKRYDPKNVFCVNQNIRPAK